MKITAGRIWHGRYGGVVRALLVSHGVSLWLFGMRIFGAENFRYWFLFWNLVLAWAPLAVTGLLAVNLRRRRWLSAQNLILTFLWLGFLPNSFYLISDLIHVHLTGEINILFDVVLFVSCIFNGLVAGFASLYLIHRQLLKRIRPWQAHVAVGLVLWASSFAIYLGRYLRWNTWDILVKPVGVLFDIGSRIINPAAYPQTVTTTIIFFLLLGSMYYVAWEFIELLRRQRR